MKRNIFPYIFLMMAIMLPDFLRAQSSTIQALGHWAEGQCQAVAVAPDTALAYIASDSTLKVLDISRLDQIKTLRTINLADSVHDIFLLNQRAYVAADDSGMVIFDLADPVNPQPLGRSLHRDAVRVVVVDTLAYIATQKDGLFIESIAQPATPKLVGSYYPEATCNDLDVNGNYVYMALGLKGLLILDVLDPTDPYYVNNISLNGSVTGVRVVNNIAYITAFNAGLVLYNVTDPYYPSILGSYVVPKKTFDVDVALPYAYVANGDSGIFIIDVSDPATPVETGFVNTDSVAIGIRWADHKIFVADFGGGLLIKRIYAAQELSHELLNYGYTRVQSDVAQSLKIRNRSNNALVLDSLRFFGTDSTRFRTELPVRNLVIPPQDSTLINIHFQTEMKEGRKFATARIYSNVINSPDSVRLTGHVHADDWTMYRDELPFADYIDVAVDTAGRVMGVPEEVEGGIVFFDGKNWQHMHSQNSELPHDDIRCVTVDRAKNVWWFGSQGGGLIRWDGVSWQQWDTRTSGWPNDSVRAVSIAPDGRVWVGTWGSGLAVLDTNLNTWQTYDTNDELPSDSIQCIAVDPFDSTIWIGTDAGAAHFDGMDWITYNSSNSDLPHDDVRAIAITHDHQVWFATYGGGMAGFDGQTWELVDRTSGFLVSDSILCLVADGGDNGWAGHPEDGLTFFPADGDPQHLFDLNAGLPVNNIQAIAFQDTLAKWFATKGGGIVRWTRAIGRFTPFLLFPDSAIAFADRRVGETDTSAGYWRNAGNATASVDSIVLAGPDAVHFELFPPATKRVHPDSIYPFKVVFRPWSAGDKSAQVLFYTNAYNSPDTLFLSGQGLSPDGEFAFSPLNFGNVRVDSTRRDSIAYRSVGTLPLLIDSIKVSSGANASYALTYASQDTLFPGDSLMISIDFTPHQAGQITAAVVAYTNAPDSSDTLYVRGTGVQPVMQLSRSLLDFGYVLVGTPKQDTIQVRNIGSDTLQVTSIDFEGDSLDFSIVSALSFRVAPGDSQAVVFQFLPDQVGTNSAYVNIMSDGGTNSIELTGTGIVNEVPTDSLIAWYPLDNSARDFGPYHLDGKLYGPTPTIDRFNTDNAAYRFSGNSYIDLPDSLRFQTRSITITAWVRPDPVNEPLPVLSYGNGGHILGIKDGRVMAGLQQQDACSVQSSMTLTTGEWTFVAMTRDSTGKTIIYVNGQKDTAITCTDNPEFPGAPAIGKDPTAGSSFFFQGDLDEIRIFARALAPEEIYAVYLFYGDKPILSASPDPVNFGKVAVGASVVRPLTLSNIGKDTLRIDSVTVVSGQNIFNTITHPQTPFLIMPGREDSLYVKFTPAAEKEYNDTLRIVSNGGIRDVRLSGTGISKTYQLYTSENSLNYGEVDVGSSRMMSFIIRNTGTEPFRDLQANITGRDSSQFQLADQQGNQYNFSAELFPDDTAKIPVTFIPTSIGSKQATLVIDSDSLTTPVTIMLYGYGTQQEMEPPQVDIDTLATNPGQDFVFSVAPPSGFHPIRSILWYRIPGDTTWHSVALDTSDTTASIPAEAMTLRGVQYYIEMSDGQQTRTYPPINPREYPAFLPVLTSRIRAGGEFKSMTYRMVSVPFYLKSPSFADVLFDDYGEYDIRQYRIVRWYPADTTYHEYSPGDTSSSWENEGSYWYYNSNYLNVSAFVPGHAFFLITRSGESFDVENAVAHGAPYPVTVYLLPGWNQIGNPFPFPIDVNSIKGNWDMIEKPVYFNGDEYRYNNQILEPWEGYFVYNYSSQTVYLSFLPIEAPRTLQKWADTWKKADEGEYILQLQAQVRNMKLKDTQNFIGFKYGAEEAYDETDVPEAPPIGDHVRLSIVEGKLRFAGNFKPITDDGHYWDVEVSSTVPAKQPVHITLIGSGRLAGQQRLYLLDRDYQCIIPITDDEFNVTLPDDQTVRHFRIIIGTEAYAGQHNENISLTPIQPRLVQNYPNPFNPETTIHYRLGKRQHIKLEIYNMLGQKIRTLVDEVQTPGDHSIRWDSMDDAGNFAASGVYIFQMRIADS